MNHISESIIRGVFTKIVRSIVNSTVASVNCHSALSNAATYRRGFRAFSVESCDLNCYLFRVYSLQKKARENLVTFRFYGGFCFDIFDSLYFISCLKLPKTTLSVKCISQSDFDLLDFDND